MPQPSLWLASLALVWGVLYFGLRAYRIFTARFRAEQRRAEQLAELHLATIEALARAIDAKDGTAENHIRRVQLYATAVARELGMSDAETQAVRTAALLHDIGKLAVPEHILSKPGPLTAEEFQKVQAHPQVGADIIAAVPFPYPVAPLIQNHHERWDGRGYPRGLKGEDIPLGARILFLVDYFDALTSNRPYHEAMTFEAAVALIEQEAGKALDPRCVEAFVRVLPQVRNEAESADKERKSGPVDATSAQTTRTGSIEVVGLQRHRHRARRDLRAVSDRPDDGDQPGRVGHDGADRVEADEPRAVLRLHAVPVRREHESPDVPLRHRHRLRADAAADVEGRPGHHRVGGAQPAAARQRAAERRPRGRWLVAAHDAAVGARVPADLRRPRHRHAGRVSHDAELLRRRPSPAARSRVRAGRGGHPQLDRVRADARSVADRSADGPAEHALHGQAPWRASCRVPSAATRRCRCS